MSQQTKIARRTFFAVLGGAAAAGVAAKIASKSPVQAAPEPAKEPQGDGYRLTDHIKKYYRTTAI
ncbi:hypothetical protein [Noviherbaspirillum denitrificans]|uniref:Formate dehydrogenase n=1 Tax=Noviherbaspirillum denitrificans TaxID=1968433 RepID=A0A254TFD8_9BURK|nr:hypothetical protein [Noviherbaspirillum denitrificans]OWW21334.1 hypothetical protein AYR66_19485 [Noviherbaspirillum denitrificans]